MHYILGHGKFGTVYRISKDKVVKIGPLSKHELRLHKCLMHPNIVVCFGAGMLRGEYGLQLQYCNGGTLFHNAKNKRNYCIDYMRDVLCALVYLHDTHGIIHRDVKLSNILLHNNKALLSDFGLSVQSSTSCKRVGTLRYMAPEVFARQTYDSRADVYSWAKTWCEYCRLQNKQYPLWLDALLVPQNERPFSGDVLKNWNLYCENAAASNSHPCANSASACKVEPVRYQLYR